jgi:pimeloyl-ACP methyl ester carboxylesterase
MHRVRLVAVGGQEIATQTVDGGQPTVVLVSAMGEPGAFWLPVVESLSSGSQIVTYDRPGIGASPPRPTATPAVSYRDFAVELAAVLDQLEVTDPTVMVGHSLGSLIIRAFAGVFPQRVAGMVHVDGTVPGWNFDWPGETSNIDGDGADATRIRDKTMVEDMAGSAVPAVPTVVLVRTPGRWATPPPSPRIDRFWQEGQAAFAQQCRGELLVAADAGHYLPREAPQLTAFAIDEVVQAVRDRSPLRINAGRAVDAGAVRPAPPDSPAR